MRLEKLEVKVQGNWYSPKRHLSELEGVVYSCYLDTTSSAGDWSGGFIFKSQGDLLVLSFEQTNCYPSEGYMLLTGEDPILLGKEADIHPQDYERLIIEKLIV
jgi:hypothetical protein